MCIRRQDYPRLDVLLTPFLLFQYLVACFGAACVGGVLLLPLVGLYLYFLGTLLRSDHP